MMHIPKFREEQPDDPAWLKVPQWMKSREMLDSDAEWEAIHALRQLDFEIAVSALPGPPVDDVSVVEGSIVRTGGRLT
jgi:hypothetical protein